MAKSKDIPIKKETKNKENSNKNNSEKSSNKSSEPAPKTEKSSTDVASNTKQSESLASQKENYIRGESQKPVTKAYRNNWKRIFN